MIPLKRLDGMTSDVNTADLQASMAGRLVSSEHADYDELRTIWNAMIDRRPGLIIEAENETDVIAAVNFARENKLLMAVRAGGHNIAGTALCDAGVVLDLQQLKGIEVDPEQRTAKVQPGITLGDLDKVTQTHGLAVPTGINSTTGISGLTLGGGFGWITRKYGLTIDNLRSARIVTAAGELLVVNHEKHADVFWAIRGGGGNFGVVTEFEFDLSPVGPEVLAGMVVHPFDDAKSIIEQYQKVLAEAPDELTCWLVMRRAPPLPFLAEEWHWKHVLILAMCYLGPIENGEAATAKLRQIGEPIADVVAPMPFVDWQSAFDPLLTEGARNYWKSHDVAEFSDAAIDVVIDAVGNLPTEECEVFFGHVGGAMKHHSADATPWPNRAAHFVVNVHTRWQESADDQRCTDWARDLYAALQPHAMGSTYVNFIPEGDEMLSASVYGPNYDRLRSIKTQIDPDNMFRTNQNITPLTNDQDAAK
jgi:FAD/FMN-containing dehydrogenase